MSTVGPQVIRGDARALELSNESVDLIVTSPPYFGLRDYGHADQLGAEPTPAEYIAALVECTREMVRVLKPSGSIFINLGDKYGPNKSLRLLPERYRVACTDELGLIARAVIVWSKPNGLPESVTDRVRRSHEDWVHLTRSARYFSAVDEIREPHANPKDLLLRRIGAGQSHSPISGGVGKDTGGHPLGRLPGSVWEIATQPLRVPAELGVDHFAAFPMEWPRRLILGWSPREVCTACGEGRRPVAVETGRVVSSFAAAELGGTAAHQYGAQAGRGDGETERIRAANGHNLPKRERVITGYACACPDTSAPCTPGVVLDPFGGTGTTALVAAMHGRQGISVDLSADYCRLAEWRVNDPKQRERATKAPKAKNKPPASEPEPLDLIGALPCAEAS